MLFVCIDLSLSLLLVILLSLSFICSLPTCETQNIHGLQVSDGYITSPNFPSAYPPDQDCLYNFSASTGLVIYLSFTEFQLEKPLARTNQCLHDYVVITITDRQARDHISERLCGSKLPPPFKTMQKTVWVHFHSSHTANERGFRMHYQFIAEESIPEPISLYYDHDRKYESHCGGRTSHGALNGEIFSPGYPAMFPRNVTCNWLIRVKAGKKIFIRLIHIGLSSTVAECDRASLYIIDGYRHEDDDRNFDDGSQIRFCGGPLYYNEEGMKSYMSLANRIIVRFTTSDYPSAEQLENYRENGAPVGFRLVWTEVDELLSDGQSCPGFTCKGGKFCIDDGQSICASRNQLCISSSLVCNGISNCAENDQSDEQYCYSQHIIIIACALLLFLFAVMIASMVWQKTKIEHRIRCRTHEHLSRASNSGPVMPPPISGAIHEKHLVVWEQVCLNSSAHSNQSSNNDSFPTSLGHHSRTRRRPSPTSNNDSRQQAMSFRSALV
ncbi:hypothetical protein AB6A40_004556 [Gnathostoma spinigerum]|uniref:CUB domain-containing protein n=1 Tax=Gnathostoma spinigerum TaxID=75299 RepID=A0ABD6EEZ9_9BILA